MVKWCSAGTCKHHHMLTDSDGKKKFSFFQFPSFEKQPERRAQWARACARVDPITKKPWQPKDTVQYVYICSAHFITGQPSKEPGHPDFIPTKFATLDVDLKLPTADESQKLRRFSNAMCRHGNKLLGKENSPSAKKRKVYTIPVGVQDSSLAASQLITPLSEVATNLYESPQPSPSSPCGSISQPTSPSVNIACETLAEEVDSLYSHEHITPQRPESPRPSTSSSCRVSPPSLGQLMLFDEISALRAERDAALVERDHARATLNSVRLSSNTVAGNNEKCQYYTGLTWHIFVTTFQFLLGSMTCKGIPSIPHIDQFFYMLVKLKHGMRFEYLADQVGIPQSTLIDHFWKWLDVTFVKLQGLVTWPEREGRFTIIPPAFKVLYPRLTCIIDCFEVFIESPGNLKARAQVWSNYKRHTTMKFLIGCNPLGAICFLSDAWGGRVSDVEIVTQSGFLTKCDHYPGDQILADRGFTMKEEFAGIASIELHTPAFTKGLSQFPAKDLESSRKLSSVRIHIERVIGLMKNRFAILQGTLPIRHIKSLKDEADQSAKSSADKIVRVCAILTNLGGGIVYKE